jgi:hypothetical protein
MVALPKSRVKLKSMKGVEERLEFNDRVTECLGYGSDGWCGEARKLRASMLNNTNI